MKAMFLHTALGHVTWEERNLRIYCQMKSESPAASSPHIAGFKNACFCLMIASFCNQNTNPLFSGCRNEWRDTFSKQKAGDAGAWILQTTTRVPSAAGWGCSPVVRAQHLPELWLVWTGLTEQGVGHAGLQRAWMCVEDGRVHELPRGVDMLCSVRGSLS